MAEAKEKILQIENLDITFRTTAGPVHAIRGVNIDLHKGETVAIVGESGSGKIKNGFAATSTEREWQWFFRIP